MSNRELQKEQLRSENKLHLLRIISESNDTDLKKVSREDLTNADIDLWGSYRELLIFAEQEGQKEMLDAEGKKKLNEKVTAILKDLDVSADAQPFFRSFLRNKLSVIKSAFILIDGMPEEWHSYYTDFIASDIEKYK